jgi:hypothetical protein
MFMRTNAFHAPCSERLGECHEAAGQPKSITPQVTRIAQGEKFERLGERLPVVGCCQDCSEPTSRAFTTTNRSRSGDCDIGQARPNGSRGSHNAGSVGIRNRREADSS